MLDVLFVSHGSPTILLERGEFVERLEKLGDEYKDVELIVVSSPHWLADKIYIHTSPNPPCVQDYYGFPDELYTFFYTVPNDVDFALKLYEKAKQNSLPVSQTQDWGLDHGAWVPLYFMFPERKIPVLPVSVSPYYSPEIHYHFGEIIKDVAEEIGKRILFVGSGSLVHRLDMIRWNYKGREIFAEGERFCRHVYELLGSGKYNELMKLKDELLFKISAPEGFMLPLFVALGVAGDGTYGDVIYHTGMYYSLSMSIVKFKNGEVK